MSGWIGRQQGGALSEAGKVREMELQFVTMGGSTPRTARGRPLSRKKELFRNSSLISKQRIYFQSNFLSKYSSCGLRRCCVSVKDSADVEVPNRIRALKNGFPDRSGGLLRSKRQYHGLLSAQWSSHTCKRALRS
jgi:hypothetical protein